MAFYINTTAQTSYSDIECNTLMAPVEVTPCMMIRVFCAFKFYTVRVSVVLPLLN